MRRDWKARRRKAACFVELGDYENAAKELKLFTARKFETNNPNYSYLRECLAQYSDFLIRLGKYEEALEAVDKGLELTEQEEYVPTERLLTLRGLAKFKMGEGGHDDWLKAQELGSEEAGRLLEEFPA